MNAPANIVLAAMLTGGLLCWDNPNPPGVVQSFNVYWRSEAASNGKWTRVTNVTETCAWVTFYLDHGVFTVTASNSTAEVPELPVGGSFGAPLEKLLPPHLK